jgi:hypothetical protein
VKYRLHIPKKSVEPSVVYKLRRSDLQDKQEDPKRAPEEVQAVVVPRAEVMPSEVKQAPSMVTLSVKEKMPRDITQRVSEEVDREWQKVESLPKLACNNCSIGPECPGYKLGAICKLNKAFKAFPTRNADAVVEAMRYILEKNKERLFRAYYAEDQVAGGQLDMTVTKMSEVVQRQLQSFLDLSDATREVGVTVVGQEPRGILSRLFGGKEEEVDADLNPALPEAKPLEINAAVVNNEIDVEVL